METGYIYSAETNKVIAEINGETRGIEKYAEENYDYDTCGLTFSPAFGFDGGLIDSKDKDIINL